MNHHLSLMPVNNLLIMKKEPLSIFKEIKKLWKSSTKESLFQWIVQLETNNSPIELFESKVDAQDFDAWLERNSLRIYRIILKLDNVNPLKLPLHLCIQRGALHAAKVLIEDGEDVEKRDSSGQTPLHLAALRNYTNIVKVLLENGANVNSVARYGITPILPTVYAKHIETLWILLSHGANPNVMSDTFGQPIHVAIQRNSINIVKILVQSGSTIDIKFNDRFEKPIEYALSKKKIEPFKVMIYNYNF